VVDGQNLDFILSLHITVDDPIVIDEDLSVLLSWKFRDPMSGGGESFESSKRLEDFVIYFGECFGGVDGEVLIDFCQIFLGTTGEGNGYFFSSH